MTITLPDELREPLELAARTAGFASVDEYVVALVREELSPESEFPDVTNSRLTPRSRAELEAMLEEGMNSEGDVVADDAFWAESVGGFC